METKPPGDCDRLFSSAKPLSLSPKSESGPLQSLVERLVEEMASAWRRGARPQVEEFLIRHPEVGDYPQAAVRLIYEEICLRLDLGQEVHSEEVRRRFPRWQGELEVLLDCHHLVEASPADPAFPEVGESLGGFRLLALLGCGALGRVFLASQSPLADRPVVLKVTPRDGEEHLSLARLQHTHIVPLYAAEDYLSQDLRVLCMPYLGGAALSELLKSLKAQPPGQRTGQDLLRVIDQAQAALPVAVPSAGPARQFLGRASYAQAVCWMGVCLADALHYAHQRGLVHLDLKPSNVLLAADGQPMLLDFHLARGPLSAGEIAPQWLGGTPGYMSPEQRAALAAVRGCREIPIAVDRRSDVYSLGLLLFEALGGDVSAALDEARRPLHFRNRQVSMGLADILRKCLANEPCDRYPDAAALAADLRQHLADLPLSGVPNRSWTERWRKWRRRRPHAIGLAALVLALLLTSLAAGAVVWSNAGQQLRQAEAALASGDQALRNRDYAEAVQTFTRGLAQAQGTPGSSDLTRALEGQLHLAIRARAAQDLHTAADHLRFLPDFELLSMRQVHALEVRCQTIWDERGLILDRRQADLGPKLEERIRGDLLDLAILWADLRVRRAPEYLAEQRRREALVLLAEAESLFGPSYALGRERQAHAEALGMSEMAEATAQLTPRTPWDHYALGRFLLRSGNLEQASVALQKAIDHQPQHFWSHFFHGMCSHRRSRPQDAVAAFTACLTLVPTSAPCYFNRALAQAALGRTDRALHDYGSALQHDPTLADAALNRGILHFRQQRPKEAIADLQQALACGADPTTVHYNLALVHLAQQDRAAALSSLNHALRHNPGHAGAAELHDRLRSPR